MPTQRLDVHRPGTSFFDPEAYDFVGAFDTHPRYGNNAARAEIVRSLEERGVTLGAGSFRQCGHCGTRIRYAALLVREDIGEYIYVGETCLDTRFTNMTAALFQELRATARLNAERVRRAERRDALIEAHPTLAWLTYPDVLRQFSSPFLTSVAQRFKQYGELSERQVAAAERAVVRESERYYARLERQARWQAEREAALPAPSGRACILGEVISVKWVAGYAYRSPDVKKIQVKTEAGWRVHMTCPSSILSVKKGDTIAVTVTLEPSADDPTFAFGKRPTGAEIITEG